MKKIVSLISILFVIILLSGCSNSNSGTIICKSEARGNNPVITSYEEYIVENNEVVGFTKYNVLDFDEEYLKRTSIENVIEIYKDDSSFKVEKVDSNTIKNIYVAPKNYYLDIESDDMIETIRASLEDNELSIYKYTCEIK